MNYTCLCNFCCQGEGCDITGYSNRRTLIYSKDNKVTTGWRCKTFRPNVQGIIQMQAMQGIQYEGMEDTLVDLINDLGRPTLFIRCIATEAHRIIKEIYDETQVAKTYILNTILSKERRGL